MTSKLKRGDIVQYHNTGSCARLNGAVGVVKAVRSAQYTMLYDIVWIAGELSGNTIWGLMDGWHGPGVLRKVADGEV